MDHSQTHYDIGWGAGTSMVLFEVPCRRLFLTATVTVWIWNNFLATGTYLDKLYHFNSATFDHIWNLELMYWERPPLQEFEALVQILTPTPFKDETIYSLWGITLDTDMCFNM